MKKRILTAVLVAPLVFTGVVFATQYEQEKENLCHRTASESHPWEAINISVNNNNHDDHEEDYPYEGPLKENGKPTKAGNAWCAENVPQPPEEEEPPVEEEPETPVTPTVTPAPQVQAATTEFVGGGK